MVKSKSASPGSSKIWEYKIYSLNYLLYIKLYINSKRGSNIGTPECTHQEYHRRWQSFASGCPHMVSATVVEWDKVLAQASKCDGGDEKMVMTGDMGSSHS